MVLLRRCLFGIPMKKAFTLIELLVVIAIIAILAAILFPVFAQAKQAAKKTQGLTHAKQIGTSSQIYLADYDDTYFPYRLNGAGGSSCGGNLDNCVNPAYQDLRRTRGQAFADANIGTSTRNVVFFNQMLAPYVKNNEIWRSPGQNGAWVNFDPSGAGTEAAFRSYGGQNSYGVNNYMFDAQAGASSIGGGYSATAIAEVSNTLLMVDASYYNVLPRFVARLAGNATSALNVCSSSYPTYWRHLGNSYRFRFPNAPTATEALRLIDQRYSGQLTVVFADTSAKSLKSDRVLNDLRDRNAQSFWDPWKQGITGSVCAEDIP